MERSLNKIPKLLLTMIHLIGDNLHEPCHLIGQLECALSDGADCFLLGNSGKLALQYLLRKIRIKIIRPGRKPVMHLVHECMNACNVCNDTF